MDEIKIEARHQYLRYFRIWFILVGIMAVMTVAAVIMHSLKKEVTRTNLSAPSERVYDYAGILSAEEENSLREYIAQKESSYQVDFVVMTFSKPVEGPEAMDITGCDSMDWEHNMMDIADAFWDENGYGFNQSFEGDGSILIDNRYEGQRGEWLSTSGSVEEALGVYAVDEVLYAVDEYYDADPYTAYRMYIDKVCDYLPIRGKIPFREVFNGAYLFVCFVISSIIVLVFALFHLGKNKAKDTVPTDAYVVGKKPVIKNREDIFLRKTVTKRRIETSSGSGGGGRSGGGGGHHTSHSGASHGGGGHRH